MKIRKWSMEKENTNDMVSTPRRVYCRLNICLLCAFSFVQTEISASGEIKQTKLHNEKHRLNEDKVSKIKLVVSDFTYDPVKDRDNGVCRKCFNSIEKIIKREQELCELKKKVETSRAHVRDFLLTLPSPRKLKVEKRLLRSPAQHLPAKQQKQANFPQLANISVKKLVNLQPLHVIAHGPGTVVVSTARPPIPILPKREPTGAVGYDSELGVQPLEALGMYIFRYILSSFLTFVFVFLMVY